MILTQDEQTVSSPADCFHQIAEAAPVPAWVADADGGVVFASRRLVEYTGTPARHLRAGAWVGLLHPGDRDRVVAAWDRAVATGEPFREEFRLRRADGVYRWHVGHAALVPDPAGVAGWWFGTATDAHDRHEADAALRESEARYRQLFESNPHPMWVYDAETLGFLAVNDAAVARYGYSRDEFLRMTIADIRPPEDVGALADAVRALPPGLHPGGTWRHRWKDGTARDGEVESHILTYGGRPARLVLATDVTERRRLEEQLRQAQKMEAVGLLAGGVAHDFNNLLTVITGYTDLLLGGLPPDDPARGLLQEVRRAGERSAGLTRQLLAFSRQQVLAPRVLDLNAVVADAEKLLRRVIGEDVRLRTALAPGLGSVRADPGQLEQVLLNLCVNARDAMPTGGELTLSTEDVLLDAARARELGADGPGGYVVLAVADTGAGMTDEVRRRLFEPFFTTKEKGKGTGLGLAVVHGIVEQSGGLVKVESEAGRGTTFRVYLPRTGAAAAGETGRSGARALPRGVETVLLVEDEPAVRALTALILKSAGYTVLEAASGDDALRVATGHAGPVHLLVTDVVMPGMGGRELADRVTTLRPGLRVLYLSGYTDDAVVRHGVLRAEVNFLQKPFAPAALGQAVREALDQPGRPDAHS